MIAPIMDIVTMELAFVAKDLLELIVLFLLAPTTAYLAGNA